jgi:ActR/RegA family two-component response regulator
MDSRPVEPQPDVLLVTAEWPERALLRAQLVEEGLGVLAVDSWAEAERLLLARAVAPRAAVVELTGHARPDAALAALRRLLPPSAVVVLTTAGALGTEAIRALGFAHVLARPFSIADVVGMTREIVGSRP